MPTKKKLSPRNKGQQERAKETYALILKAATRILAREPASLTTNRVAEEAGISIGSLYQYFPNKESILNELIETEFRADTEVIREACAKFESRPLQEMVDGLIEMMWKIGERPKKLQSALFQILGATKKFDVLQRIHFEHITMVSELLKTAPDWRSGRKPQIVSFVCLSLMASLLKIVNDYDEFPKAAFRAEIELLFRSYIEAS